MTRALIIPTQRCPAAQNPALVYLARLTSPRSRETMLQSLDTIAGMVTDGQATAITFAQAWGDLRYQHTQAIRARLVERYAPATANRLLSALRQVLKEAWRLGYMTAEQYQAAGDVPNVSDKALPAGRDLALDEIAALLRVCAGDGLAGRRDAAIIGVLWSAGLRRAEAARLQLEDYDSDNGRLFVRGKGGKERYAYLDDGTLEALARWLAWRGEKPGPLWYHVNKADQIRRHALSAQGIYYMLVKRGRQAGLENFTPHDFRRTFVGDLLDEGVDISTVARMAGHASVATTQRYDRRGERTKREAARRRRLPLE